MDRAVNFGTLHSSAIKAYSKGTTPNEINVLSHGADKGPYDIEAIRIDFAKEPDLANTLIISKRDLQCNAIACDFFADDGSLAIWDYSHWTLRGAEMFMTRLVDQHPDIFR